MLTSQGQGICITHWTREPPRTPGIPAWILLTQACGWKVRWRRGMGKEQRGKRQVQALTFCFRWMMSLQNQRPTESLPNQTLPRGENVRSEKPRGPWRHLLPVSLQPTEGKCRSVHLHQLAFMIIPRSGIKVLSKSTSAVKQSISHMGPGSSLPGFVSLPRPE